MVLRICRHLQQRIITGQLYIRNCILDRPCKTDARNFIIPVMQFINRRLKSRRSLIRSKVEPAPVCRKRSTELINGIFRQEMIYLKILYMQIGSISFGSTVKGSSKSQSAFSFFQQQAGVVFRPFHPQTSVKKHTIRDNQRCSRRHPPQCRQEIKISCLHFQVKSSRACGTICQIIQFAATLQRESTGQIYFKTGNLHRFQVAFRTRLYY